MNDYKIVIDPGHGGVDSGASGNGIIEKNLTLDISKYMYDRFKELGVPVSITRLDDSTLSPTDRVNKILSFYGSNPNVIVISNHINAGGVKGSCGKLTFFEIIKSRNILFNIPTFLLIFIKNDY